MESISIKNKALSINLDSEKYGVIAEIGGGQEVARAFFKAGGASGTIAKSISAYDKIFSDALYNQRKPGRYVSEDRLFKMLTNEYEELVKNLHADRGHNTAFFVFADTVEILNYHKSNSGHGWMGMQFQLKPNAPVNTVIIHVNLHENDSLLQQYTLGSIGINLIFACFNYYDRPNAFLKSLMDNLDRDRVEIDMITMQGNDLDYVDNRLLSVQLVKNGMTSVSLFDRNGKVMRPAELFYKKNVLVLRGSFRPLTYTLVDMLKSGTSQFRREADFNRSNAVTICEMTINNLQQDGEFDEKDFLDRVDVLNDNGQNVMITDFQEFYKLSRYFSQYHIEQIRILLGANTLTKLFQPEYYPNLNGGVLEAIALLFPENTALYVYPAKDTDNQTISSNKCTENTEYQQLFLHLIQHHNIVDIKAGKKADLRTTPGDVMKYMCNNDPQWETYVPVRVASLIKEKGLFSFCP
jgi:hypothetical protein